MSDVAFEVRTDLAPIQNTIIDANFDECKAALEEMMSPYAALIVTEDTVPAAKGDRASIRKVRERIDHARKTVKGIYTEPLKAFEAQCKELTDICDRASGHIDGQIKAFEAAQKTEKLKRLEDFFSASVGDVSDYLTWHDILNDKWGNITYSETKAQEEIIEAVKRCGDDLTAIRGLNSEHELSLLDYYKKTHDLSACIRRDADLKALAEHERKSKEAREKMLAEARAKEAETVAAESKKPTEDNVVPFTQPKKEPVGVVDFRVWVTKAQLMALKQFLLDNDITYGRVPKEVSR